MHMQDHDTVPPPPSLPPTCVPQIAEFEVTVQGLETERDFYFSKLRDIELLCQENEAEGAPVIQQIMDVMYATQVKIR